MKQIRPRSLEVDFTLCDSTCHSTQTTDLLTDGVNTGAIDDPNLVIWTHLYPLEEAEANSELRQYIILTQLIGETVDGQPFVPDLQGLAAWSAGRLFEEAVKIAVENLEAEALTGGLAGFDSESGSALPQLTQEAVAQAMTSITDWTSRGLHQPTNPAEKTPTPCFVMLAWSPAQASWQRQHPSTPGEWDCQEENLYALRITPNLGLDS